MKKKLGIVMVATILAVSLIALVACSSMTVKTVDSQIKALTEVKASQSDVAIIDSTMAGYLINKEGSDFSNLAMVEGFTGFDFEKEYYAVAGKKGEAKLMAFVNNGIKESMADGKYNEIATKYGLTSRKVANITDEIAVPEDWKSELNTAGKVVIGYTNNAPMGITNEDNTQSGFDIDLAKYIFEKAGVTVECKLIEWGSKEIELNSDKIDLVWNGLTRNEEREKNMELSKSYLVNEQAIVVLKDKAASIKSIDDLNGMTIAAEQGSAGLDAAEAIMEKLTK